jgi:YihY family inner membrane protein
LIGRLKRGLKHLDATQRRHSWLAFPVAVVKKFGDDQAGRLAALVAYYGFFSLFPLLLVMVTVLGYVLSGNDDLQQRVLDSALTQFPVIGDQINENVDSLNGNLVALLIGVIGALWAGLAALQAMQTAMNEVWDVPIKERPNFLTSRLRALLMLVVLGGGVIGIVVLGAAGTFSQSLGVAAIVLSAVLAFVLATGVFLLAFRVLPTHVVPWRSLLPGALVAATGFLALQLIGGYYVSHAVKGASQSYGVFAVVIGLLSWMHLQAQIALFAAEVNVVSERRLWPRSLFGDDLTAADASALCSYAKVEERRHDEDVSMSLGDAPAEADAPAEDVGH